MMKMALDSAHRQTVFPAMVLVERDITRTGAAAARNRALQNVSTEWVAFLDDDDIFYPDHVRLCLAKALQTGADVVYPWFDLAIDGEVDNDQNPLAAPQRGRLRSPFGLSFGPEQEDHLIHVANFIPVTVLARTEAIRSVGGFNSDVQHEDWDLWKRLLDVGATFAHLGLRTWRWNWHAKQTAGAPAKNGFTDWLV